MPEYGIADHPSPALGADHGSLDLGAGLDPLALGAERMSRSLLESEYPSLISPGRSAAESLCELIIKKVQQFESFLDNEHEVALMLASFGQDITLSVTSIGWEDPDILVFYGFVGKRLATLIQHISQLNFLMIAMEKNDPDEPPRRIVGFSSSEDGGWRKG